MNLLDQYKGILVGVHIGDSLGAPYETWKPKAITTDLKERGRLQFFDYPNPWKDDGNGPTLPAGRPTDDSDQTADLCYSLLACGELDPKHLREALRNSVHRHVSRLWDGKATGSGGTTRDSLHDDPQRVTRALSNTIGTNGSLMRCAPMALWFGPRELTPQDRELVRQMSAVTHAHPHSVDACWLYTKVLVALLKGKALRHRPFENALEERVWSRLHDEHDLPYDPGAFPERGRAEFSLYVALYALYHSESFAHGIEQAVRVGGDTDTYAAIAGGLLGTYYGYEGIPQEWRETILGHDQMVEYATKLYERQHS